MNVPFAVHSTIVSLILCLPLVIRNVHAETAVYPKSTCITGIHFDLSTLRNACPGNGAKADGSDNWTITWADDDHQYTSWGDGGGFGGNNAVGRVSMGVARVAGGKTSYTGHNVWGGKNPESPATFRGKCYGIISIRGELFMWRTGDGSDAKCYGLQELRRSIDHGRTWKTTNVSWTFSSGGFFAPTFLQFGKDYEGARDNYVYSYASEHTTSVNPNDTWGVNKPGKIVLMRVPIRSIGSKSTYRFFSGFDNLGNPKWSLDINHRKPIFEDAKNGVMRTSVIFNPWIRRYILVTQQVTRYRDLDGKKGHMGIYEAPEPWGPWSTVLFDHPWNIGAHPHLQNDTYPGAAKTVYFNFSPKWWSNEGKRFVMVYTGPGGDQWGTVEGAFTLASDTPGHSGFPGN